MLDKTAIWLSVGGILGLIATYAIVLFGKPKPKYLTLYSIVFGFLGSFLGIECMCSNYDDWLVGETIISCVACLIFIIFYVGIYIKKLHASK